MPISKPNDILALYKRDEKSAFRLLFDTYYVPLVLFVNRMIQNEHSSEDIVQETLINFWQKKRILNVTGRLDNYLFESVKNKALDYIKSNDRRIEVHQSAYEDQDSTNIFDSPEADEYAKLYKAIEQLPDDRKKVFKLVYIEGYKSKEAAEVLNISINTVQTQLRRSLQFLREQLTPNGTDETDLTDDKLRNLTLYLLLASRR